MATHDRMHTEDAAGVLYAERSRCQALEKDDFGVLEALISPQVTHTPEATQITSRVIFSARSKPSCRRVRSPFRELMPPATDV